ncbi:hypothetical protein [Paraflavitalea sp. CAU 1676]|uniref:hypothetical protein n=1 Tax=Paraflavitalea sp. CAU 1676 TaxID=3032598 RepID=UPI0023DC989F|nr:hypothetical protein [Paraflavitalea sp. CAU 1676]MDF2187732.1 hypothetical protein [Paraflavitalea sp. CAU 1676]
MYRFAIVILLILATTVSWGQGPNNIDTTANKPTKTADKADPAKEKKEAPAEPKKGAGEDAAKAAPPAKDAKPAAPAADSTGNDQKKKDSIANAVAEANKAGYIKSWKEDFDHPERIYADLKRKSIAFPLLISFVLIAGTGLWLLSQTALCKDASYYPETSALRPAKDRPYSFARVQLFWWTVIILSCYLTFYIYTGYLVALPPSSVILLGGGLAVSMFGKMIDNTQLQKDKGQAPIRHQDLTDTQGLFIDLLSDEGGISIHRFQTVIFNLIFGIAYISSFLTNVGLQKFPFIEFESWQLAMLGISAGAYLGFKTNENSEGTKAQRKVEAVRNAQAAQAAQPAPVAPAAPGAMVAPPAPATTNAYQRLEAEVAAM